MKAFRVLIAALLVACALPALILAAAWVVSAASGCPLQLETPHTCRVSGLEIGGLMDALVEGGVWGALTLGLGAYVFAAWVMAELAAIVLSRMRRS
jgi:hypothetical protein